MSGEQVSFSYINSGTAEVMAYGDEINFLESIHEAATRKPSGETGGQIYKERPATTQHGETATDEVPTSNKKGEELKAELDDLLDEIDEVLEENAEEFVRSYVQKGGQ